MNPRLTPILLATGNPHKVSELTAILAAANATATSIPAWQQSRRDQGLPAHIHEPAETGDTFDANSAIKALAYAKQTTHLCLADDSGLEVDALQGRPGVISSHYASNGQETGLPRDARDRANNQQLLHDLRDVPLEKRSARFVCVMTLASPDRILFTARGTFEGRIGLPPNVPRGNHGFGYDPLFLVAPDFTLTGAELTSDQKNRLSHRAQAATRLVAWLCQRK